MVGTQMSSRCGIVADDVLRRRRRWPPGAPEFDMNVRIRLGFGPRVIAQQQLSRSRREFM
jgi:hypothetical protein